MKFELGTSTLELISPAQYPYPQNTKLVQAKEKSSTGVTHVEDFHLKDGTYTYNFVDMHTSDYTALLSFHVNEAVGMMNQFFLTDDLGARRLVRFLSPEIAFINTFKDLWQGSFMVEEQI